MMRRFLLAVMSLALLVVVGCKGNNADESAEKDQESAASVTSDESEGGESDEAAKAPATDRYPKIPFGKLSAKERTAFLEVAKAELCPCEGSTESLDACLQDESKHCSLALGAAGTAMQSIGEGLNKTDTLDKIAEFIEVAKKEHTFDLADTPHKGTEEEPKVVVVEFADFECPYCMRTSLALAEVLKKYEGKPVRMYYKHFPLGMHKNAQYAARAATAAHLQGKFWPMHDLVFKNQRSLSEDKIDSFAQRIGLNFGKFRKDVKSDKVAGMVAKDRKEGENAQITGTPTLFINGRRYLGPPDSPADLEAAIDEALEATTTTEAEPSN